MYKKNSKAISKKKSLEEKLEEMIKRSSPQSDQQEIISKLTSKNESLKRRLEKFFFSQKSLDSMLTSTKRSHNLVELGYSSTHDISHDHIASTSKHHHFRKV